MKNIYNYIIEQTSLGKMPKQVAIDIIEILKRNETANKINMDIAIIGIDLKTSLADSPKQFWRNLRKGKDCIRNIPRLRKQDLDDYLKNHHNKELYQKTGYLEEIDKFDYSYFRLSPKEASLMDPNQRIFLEAAYAVINDAGQGKRIANTRTGLYVGFFPIGKKYQQLISEARSARLPESLSGNIEPMISGRISYLLDLKGPSMLVNTACSSSLVALHLACKSIQRVECDQAIAGGIKLNILPLKGSLDIGIESKDGYTRSFDDKADGTNWSEGAAAVFLKPLSRALADKDHIYAVIKGSAINHDGASAGLTAPNAAAQAEVIEAAWKDAGVDPKTISYIEAHGTGTKLGDPIEIKGLDKAFRKYTSENNICRIGSVKSNIGHTSEASGILGLIKTALALSGTNCHVILEEAPPIQSREEKRIPRLLLLSAKTEAALKTTLESYQNFLKEHRDINLVDLCYTAATGRDHHGYRLAIVIKNRKDLREKLSRLARTGPEEWKKNRNKDIFCASPQTKSRRKQERPKLSALADSIVGGDASALRKLAGLYVEGVDPDWDRFYQNEDARKVSLPPYPFEKKRCWIEVPEIKDASPFFHHLIWQKEPPNIIAHRETGTILLFSDDQGLIVFFKEKLTDARVITVSHGFGFKRISPDEYMVGATQKDYDRLLADFEDKPIKKIIHAFARDSVKSIRTPEELDFNLERGVFSLFRLTKAILKSAGRSGDIIDIILLTNSTELVTGKEDRVYPENATLVGLGKAISLENPHLRCRALDIDEKTDNKTIVAEINSPGSSYKTAYRNNVRYIEVLDELDLNILPERKFEIKDGSTYVITGVLGSLGLATAKYLTRQNKLKLALIVRTPLPPRTEWDRVLSDIQKSKKNIKLAGQIETIREIESAGSEVAIYSADVAREKEISNAIGDIRKKYGQINGVIHAAGIAGDGFIIRKDEQIFRNVLAPKVTGTWLLDRLTQKDKLDFFISFSSSTSIFSAPGQGDYTAANAYLDAFSRMKKSGKKGRVFSINWAAWQEAGMVVDHKTDISRGPVRYQSDKAALTALAAILTRNLGGINIMAGEVNYENLGRQSKSFFPVNFSLRLCERIKERDPLKSVFPEKRNDVEAVPVFPALKGKKKDKDYTETEKKVAAMWQAVLGYQEIDINDNFFEIGGNSLLIIQVHKKLEKHYLRRINIAQLFTHTTIAKLAEYLTRTIKPKSESLDAIPASTVAPDTTKDIAIVGIALKTSQAENAAEFWQNLITGRDCLRELPKTRKEDVLRYLCFKQDAAKTITQPYPVIPVAGYLSNIDIFDHSYFKLSPKEAVLMDPNQRMFLEIVYAAIDDAGEGRRIANTKTGLYLGFAANHIYRQLITSVSLFDGQQSISGNIAGIIPSRISYLLNLSGPSLVTDTTCSSSLVALHLASKAIQRGECDQAIAGGIKLNILPIGKINIGIESKDGFTRSFDESADGTNWSEAVAAVFLKPLAKAITDKDNIYAVIKGSAINQDGTSAGLTAPNAKAQEEVIISAWKDAQIDPRTVSYIEAHGTGTKLGDPVEIEGISQAFRRYTDARSFCLIGSAKSNIGHTAEASGLVSLIKSCLALKNKKITSSIHFHEPNRKVDWDNAPVSVVTKLTAWKRSEENTPLRCGVSSFGLSGTNCHVVLEEAPPSFRSAELRRTRTAGSGGTRTASRLLLLSAKTENALKNIVGDYHKFLSNASRDKIITLEDICFTAACGRDHHEYRLAVGAKNIKDLKRKLGRLSADLPEQWRKNGRKDFYCYGHAKTMSAKERKRLTRSADNLILDGLGQLELARLYVRGANPDWYALYRNEDVHKISLPSYPFERTRSWIETPEVKINGKVEVGSIHPLLEKHLLKSIDQDIYETEFSADRFFVLSDHKIRDKHVLPGIVYLEMGCKVGRMYFSGGPVELKNISFLTPAILEKGEKRVVQMIVRKNKDCLRFSVVSRLGSSGINAEKSWIKHAEGEIWKLTGRPETEAYDISGLKKECGETIEMGQSQSQFITFGPRWHNCRNLTVGKNTALAELSLPPEFLSDLDIYYLHPALLDMAVGAAFISLRNRAEVLPLSYKSLKIYGPTPARFYSYFRKIKDDFNRSGIISFDTVLMDTSGRIFAEITDFTIKKVPDDIQLTELNKTVLPQSFFYRPQWTLSPLLPQEGNTGKITNDRILIFRHDNDFKLAEALKKLHKDQPVVEILLDNQYIKISDNIYKINYRQPEDYNKILTGFGSVSTIYFLGSMELKNQTIDTLKQLDHIQELGVLSLLKLLKTIVNTNQGKTSIELKVITNNVHQIEKENSELYPFSSPVIGLVKAVAREHPKWHLISIDIDKKDTQNSQSVELLAAMIKNETRDNVHGAEVAIRKSDRYVLEILPVEELAWKSANI